MPEKTLGVGQARGYKTGQASGHGPWAAGLPPTHLGASLPPHSAVAEVGHAVALQELGGQDAKGACGRWVQIQGEGIG